MTIREAEMLVKSRLKAAGLDNSSCLAESQALVHHAAGVRVLQSIRDPDFTLLPRCATRLWELTERRAAREPLGYILGTAPFNIHEFLVDARVLVPRPETAGLVDHALKWIGLLRRSQPSMRPLIVDVGCGSGCIGISLALEIPGAAVFASDLSRAALEVARLNIERFGVGDRVRLVQGDLISWLGSGPDLVVANLPYVPTGRFPELEPEVSVWEPRFALDGGADGADLIRRLLVQLIRIKFGCALLEVDEDHAYEVERRARSLFPRCKVGFHNDLSGRPRVLRIERARGS